MKRGTFCLLGFLALAACKSNVVEQGVLVNVTNLLPVPGITNLQATVSQQGKGKTLLFPPTVQTTPISFPTAFSFTVQSGRSGQVDIAVDGLDANGAVVAYGAASAVLQAGVFVTVTAVLQPGVSLCGNRKLDFGETCDDGDRISGDGCDFLCRSADVVDAAVDSGSATDAPGLGDVSGAVDEVGMGSEVGAGGANGTGGAIGTGGIAGTGGAIGSGGTTGFGGDTGTGGAVGTGGNTGTGGTSGSGGSSGSGGAGTVLCSPPCKADQDCAGGACIPRRDSCISSTDCLSSAVANFKCCGPTEKDCAGTRLPAGDTSNLGQFVVSAAGLTVSDTITGLVWQRDGLGTRDGCTGNCIIGKCTTCTWKEASDYCSGLRLGSVSGWRLPSRMELRTIVDFMSYGPAIDRTAFPDTPSDDWFWTSTPSAPPAGTPPIAKAWRVSSLDGVSKTSSVDDLSRVRCVR